MVRHRFPPGQRHLIMVQKNLNATHRIDGHATQFGINGALAASQAAGKAKLPTK
jgi:hypothetical protein